MDKGNPIEIINPGNGYPGGTVSPQEMACEPYRGPGGGFSCPILDVPSCPPKNPCPIRF